jgi:hypothetical protein
MFWLVYVQDPGGIHSNNYGSLSGNPKNNQCCGSATFWYGGSAVGYPTLEQEGQADLNDVEVAVCCGWTPGRQPSHPRIYATGSPAPKAI